MANSTITVTVDLDTAPIAHQLEEIGDSFHVAAEELREAGSLAKMDEEIRAAGTDNSCQHSND